MRTVPIINAYIVPQGLAVLPVNVSPYVIALQFLDSDSKADKLTLTIDNDDLSNFDEPLWRDGNGVRVSWGYAEALTVERLVTIKRVTGFRELKVEAVGGELGLDRVKRNVTYEKMSYSQIAKKIAESWGYVEPRVQHIEETSAVYELTVQPAITDGEMMRKLCAKTNFKWFMRHDGFHFHSPNFLQPTEKRLRYRGNQNPSEILDVHIDIDVTRIADAVQVANFNPQNGPGIKVTATNWTNPQKQGLAERMEAGQVTNLGVPGMNLPADAPIPPFGMLPSAEPSSLRPQTLGPSTYVEMKRTNETDIAAIRRNAEAARERMMHGVVKMKVNIVGDPNVNAGTVVEIDGIGKRLSQRYYVSQVEHRIGSSGYHTELECVSDGTAGHSTKSRFLPEATEIQMAPKALSQKFTPSDGPGIKTPADSRERDPRVEPREPVGPPDVKPTPEPLMRPHQVLTGNIDLQNRPYHRNKDGSYSTLLTIGVELDGLEYNIPTVNSDDGHIMSTAEAVRYLRSTGKHLGVWNDQKAAEEDAKRIHREQAANPPNNTLGPTPADARVLEEEDEPSESEPISSL